MNTLHITLIKSSDCHCFASLDTFPGLKEILFLKYLQPRDAIAYAIFF